MKTIDFTKLKVFTDISQEQTHVIDDHKGFADLVYKNVPGIAAHELAMRIYKSDGPIEVSEEDLQILIPFVEQCFTPIYIDSFKANIIEKQKLCQKQKNSTIRP